MAVYINGSPDIIEAVQPSIELASYQQCVSKASAEPNFLQIVNVIQVQSTAGGSIRAKSP